MPASNPARRLNEKTVPVWTLNDLKGPEIGLARLLRVYRRLRLDSIQSVISNDERVAGSVTPIDRTWTPSGEKQRARHTSMLAWRTIMQACSHYQEAYEI